MLIAVRLAVAMKQSCSIGIDRRPYIAAIGSAATTASAALSVTVAQPL